MKKKSVLFILQLFFVISPSFTDPLFAQAPSRTVLIEKFTGEWCGWCPIGMMELEDMIEKYGDTIIVVAVHFNDPLEAPSANGMIGVWGNMAPTALINREYDTIIDSQIFVVEMWDEVIERQINNPAPCNVGLTYSYNEITREVIATVTSYFTDSYIGDGRLNLYIVEDYVIGVSQSNYLSGNPDFINTPFYSLPENIPNFEHQHVLREMVGESYGIADIIPDTVYAGQQFQYTFNYIIPEEYNLENLHLIGVVQQYRGLKKYRKILNSIHRKFDPSTVNIAEQSKLSSLIISPIPAGNSFRLHVQNNELIQQVQVFSVNGKQVYSCKTSDNDIQIDSRNFPDGFYIIRVETNKNRYYRKILIRK